MPYPARGRWRRRAGPVRVLRLPKYLVDLGRHELSLPAETKENPQVARHVVQHDFFPRLLADHRIHMTHLAGIRTGSGVISLAGPSGRGKSTLTAGFGHAGADILSDDCLKLDPCDDAVLCAPLDRAIRLWPDAYEAMFAGRAHQADLDAPKGKRGVALSRPGATAGTDRSNGLQAIYWLERPEARNSRSTVARLSRQAPVTACSTLLRSSFSLNPLDRDWAAWLFDRCAGIADSVPVYSLAYPRRFDLLPALVRCLQARHRRGMPPDDEVLDLDNV